MSETSVQQQIAALEAMLASPMPDVARQSLEATLRALRAQAAAVTGQVDVSGEADVVVGVNLGTIIYGRDPTVDEQRRLTAYLERLAAKLIGKTEILLLCPW